MRRDKGIAYCGLACAVCGQNQTCAGCRNEGCADKDWCKNFQCCKANGLKGCWECQQFPCSDSMLSKQRIRAFARLVKEYGEEKLLNCLERNEKDGFMYHYPGELTGDYDKPQTEEGIINLVLTGRAE